MTTDQPNPDSSGSQDAAEEGYSPISEVFDIPEAVHGWTLSEVSEDHAEWWRTGSTHVRGEYQRHAIRRYTRDGTRWNVTHSAIDQFGNVVNSRTVFQKKTTFDGTDYGSWALGRAISRMKKRPGDGTFTQKPTIPDNIGKWSLKTDSPTEWVWSARNSQVRVQRVGVASGYCTSSAQYSTTVSTRESEVDIAENTPAARALRAAVRCMEATPDGIFDESWSPLQRVTGIGPAKAIQLQALGITNAPELQVAVSGTMESADPEFRALIPIYHNIAVSRTSQSVS